MKLHAEILREIYDTLKEVEVPFKLSTGLDITLRFDDQHAEELAQAILARLIPFLPPK